jgi:hypothetical protein
MDPEHKDLGLLSLRSGQQVRFIGMSLFLGDLLVNGAVGGEVGFSFLPGRGWLFLGRRRPGFIRLAGCRTGWECASLVEMHPVDWLGHFNPSRVESLLHQPYGFTPGLQKVVLGLVHPSHEFEAHGAITQIVHQGTRLGISEHAAVPGECFQTDLPRLAEVEIDGYTDRKVEAAPRVAGEVPRTAGAVNPPARCRGSRCARRV